jgi:hypothetical protein
MTSKYPELLSTNGQPLKLGPIPVVAKHRLHELDLFSDSALIDLLNSHPRDQLQAFTMGTDCENRQEWQPVDTAGATGSDLFSAVANGHLWFNVLRVQQAHPTFRELLRQLFSEFVQLNPGLQCFNQNATLIISSPQALVYYHADAQPNLLWHIRGSKRVWVYPAGDVELIEQELMEDIFASYMDEEVPYKAEFDAKAEVFDLHPGDVITWPQNSPHRVTNLGGLNVSLSAVYETAQSSHRKLIYCANRLFRRTYHLPARSTKETAISTPLKTLTYRGIRKLGLIPVPPRRAYVTSLKINPDAPGGFERINDGPILTEFSKKEFVLQRDQGGRVSAVAQGKTR